MRNVWVIVLSSLVASSSVALTSEQKAFVAIATDSIKDFRARCEADKGDLWGESLCVPMILVEMNSKLAVSSAPDPHSEFTEAEGVYIGHYGGPQTFANTSLLWEKQRWSMVVSWSIPASRSLRSELLMHEAWHSIQDALRLPMGGAPTPHLDTEEARVFIRSEWAALLAAMKAPAKQSEHLRNALAFRRARLTNAERTKAESALEMSEGLASYTGVKLSTSTHRETLERLEILTRTTAEGPSVVRSFAYVSGPLYGLLLDRLSSEWKRDLMPQSDLSLLAARYFKIDIADIPWPNERALKEYNFEAIKRSERKRAEEKQKTVGRYLKRIATPDAFVFDPGLGNVMRTFDPNAILSLEDGRFLYLTFGMRGEWGNVEIKSGALMRQGTDDRRIMLSALTKQTKSGAHGEGWKLELNEGWRLKKDVQRKMFIFVKEESVK